ncbi:MAG TPA: hypothetical protein VFN55_10865 [Solirubrobacteraceae bacterium]|nr:hypothetical protein [Solirubrobacteraceae bacterium]
MSEFEREQEEAAAAEAARIGGNPGAERYVEDGEEVDPAQIPLMEAGEGEAEGFEQAEEALIDNASHGDMHTPDRILEDAPADEAAPGAAGGEADSEHSSEDEDSDR